MLVSRWRTRICRVSDDQGVDVISEGWLQFLFVAVPVLSLVGTWMGLRTAGRLVQRLLEIETYRMLAMLGFPSARARSLETMRPVLARYGLSLAEFDVLVRDLWAGCGLGQLEVDWDSGQHGFLAIRLRDSPMQDIGPSGHVGDDMFAGILGGFFAGFCDAEMRSVQTGDLRLGDREGTTFIVAAVEVARRVEGMRANKQAHSAIVATLAAGGAATG